MSENTKEIVSILALMFGAVVVINIIGIPATVVLLLLYIAIKV